MKKGENKMEVIFIIGFVAVIGFGLIKNRRA